MLFMPLGAPRRTPAELATRERVLRDLRAWLDIHRPAREQVRRIVEADRNDSRLAKWLAKGGPERLAAYREAERTALEPAA